MDSQGARKSLEERRLRYLSHFEQAQGCFPQAMIKLGSGGIWEQRAALKRFARIKDHLLKAAEAVSSREALRALAVLEKAGAVTGAYPLERFRDLSLMYSFLPPELLKERENLRRSGYIVYGHAMVGAGMDAPTPVSANIAKRIFFEASSRPITYRTHIELITEITRAAATIQSQALGAATPYDALLTYLTPGASAARLTAMIDDLLSAAAAARRERLAAQTEEAPPLAAPAFTREQGIKLVERVCEIIPIPDPTYQTVVLHNKPPMCMEKTAIVGYGSPDPKVIPDSLAFLETAFHEHSHLRYRWRAAGAYGINGFHLDEARALCVERFLLREDAALKRLSRLLQETYGEAHPAFDFANLQKRARWVQSGTAALNRPTADDLTYVIHECIRTKAELNLVNGGLSVDDYSAFLGAETEQALGVAGVDGYDLWKQTFQDKMCMQGHVAAYVQGMVMAAQLHRAFKAAYGDALADPEVDVFAAHLAFIDEAVDRHGAAVAPQAIIETATGEAFQDPRALVARMDAAEALAPA